MRLKQQLPSLITSIVFHGVVPAAMGMMTYAVAKVDNAHEAYFNGVKDGSAGSFPPDYRSGLDATGRYVIKPEIVKPGKNNVLAIRVYDHEGRGGFKDEAPVIIAGEQAISTNGRWEFRTGDDVEWAKGPTKLTSVGIFWRAFPAKDVIKGFAAGADDYLPKPTELAILLARINGLIRRSAWSKKSTDTFTFAGRTIDFDALEIRVGDRAFPLTLMEANLLRYLIDHEGMAVSRKAMLEDVWSLREDTDTRAIDNFIVRLRRYIEDDPSNPRHLLTVRGVGYRFVAAPEKR